MDARQNVGRRTLMRGAAWTAPAVLSAQKVAAAAASCNSGVGALMKPSGMWYVDWGPSVTSAGNLTLGNVLTFYMEDVYMIIRGVPAGYWLQNLELGYWQQQRIYSNDKGTEVSNLRNWGWAAPLKADPNNPQAWKDYVAGSQPPSSTGWSNVVMPPGMHSVDDKVGYPQTPAPVGPKRAFQLTTTWSNPDKAIATKASPWNANNSRTVRDSCGNQVQVWDTFTSIFGKNYANPPSTSYQSGVRFDYEATTQFLTNATFKDNSSKYGKTAYYGYRAVLKNKAGQTMTVSFSNNPHDLMPWRNSKVGATAGEAKAAGIDYVYLFVDGVGAVQQ